MPEDPLLDMLRALLEADLAERRFQSVGTYLRTLGRAAEGRHDEVRAEYERIVLPAVLASGGTVLPAATGDFAGGPPSDGAASPLPRAESPDGTDSAITALDPLPGGLTERGEIARGGMGAVVRVRDDVLRRDLAMKVTLDDPSARTDGMRRFVAEAQIQAQLDHPGVAPVHHLGRSASGRLCFTMKLVKGRSLEDVIERVRAGTDPRNLTRAVQWLLRVCETVGYAHEKGVVHRDLKPANVMIGNFGEVYVMDWGLARVLGAPDSHSATPRSVVLTAAAVAPAAGAADTPAPRLTQQGDILGTPSYMSPEQARGASDLVDARSDVYALGAILYEFLAGHAPYCEPGTRRNGLEIVRASIEGPPVPLRRSPEAPEELVAVADKAMSRTPGDRYANAREMAEDLQRWIEGRVVRAHRTGAFAELRTWVRRNRGVAVTAAATTLVLAGASVRYTLLERDARIEIRAERDAAVAARDEARRAARRALGMKLAGDAILEADREPAKAAALALEAAALAPGPKSVDALYAALRDVAEVRTLSGHVAYLEAGAWAPDGRRAYTADREGLVIAWDVTSGTEVCRARATGEEEELAGFDLSADGRRLATAGRRGGVAIRDTSDLEPVCAIDTGGEAAGGIALSPDGARVAVTLASGDLVLCDAATGAETARIAGHGGASHRAAWSPDGRFVASRGSDLSVCVADAGTGRAGYVLACGDDPAQPAGDAQGPPPLREVAWAADGTRLVAWTAAVRGGGPVPRGAARVRVFDADRRAEIPREPRGTAEVVLAFAPDRRAVAIQRDPGSGASEARVLDLVAGTDGPAPWDRGETGGLRPFAWRPDGLVYACPDRDYGVAVRTAAAGLPLQRLAGHLYAVSVIAFSPDGRTLLTGSHDRSVRLWDVAPSRVRRGVALRVHPGVAPFVHSCDAEGRLAGVVWRAKDGTETSELVDSGTGDVVWQVPAGGAAWIVPSPDGRRMAISSGGTIDVYDVTTRRRIARLTLPGAGAPAFDPSGRRLAVFSRDAAADVPGEHAYVLDADAPGPPLRLTNPEPGGDGGLRGASWSPDGSMFAAAHGYTGPVVWDTRTGEVRRRYPGHTGMVIDTAFSPDGQRLASQAMDTTVRVWDVATGAQIARCTVAMRTGRVSFSADGSVVAFVHPASLALFDAATGRAISRIPAGDTPFADRLSANAAGDLVTVDRAGRLRLWPADPEAWVRDHVTRRLTPAERIETGLDEPAPGAGAAK